MTEKNEYNQADASDQQIAKWQALMDRQPVTMTLDDQLLLRIDAQLLLADEVIDRTSEILTELQTSV